MIRTFTPRGWALVAGLGAAAIVPFALAPVPPLALVNESPSQPRGVYVRRPDRSPTRGAVVAVRQPPGSRIYLSGLGAPEGMPLLKRVAAVSGDVVCHDRGRTAVMGFEVLVMTQDRRGTALPVWSACRRLEGDEIFLLGDTASSFDSRYFGPVRRTDVLGVYERVGR